MQEADFTSLWVVFDFVDLDLRKLIGSPQTISVAHVQWIVHQMLVAIKYLHSAHVNPPARVEPEPQPAAPRDPCLQSNTRRRFDLAGASPRP